MSWFSGLFVPDTFFFPLLMFMLFKMCCAKLHFRQSLILLFTFVSHLPYSALFNFVCHIIFLQVILSQYMPVYQVFKRHFWV